ncbi:MAG: hypothetical protein HY673_08000 [Chloroflexi bacterium]|nr:hypothetical protein [Chloroflexota bacterium]
MDIKKRPNHKLYLEILRKMTPEQRLLKAFELTEFSRQLFLDGLRSRFPEKSEDEIKKIYLERLDKCHNRNW